MTHRRHRQGDRKEAREVQIQRAEAFLSETLSHCGVSARVKGGVGSDNQLHLDVEGGEIASLFFNEHDVPNRQLVDALQHLVRETTFGPDQGPPVTIDGAGYAEQRSGALDRLADRLAEVIEDGRIIDVLGMHPADRKAVHRRLGEHEDISTTSVGFGAFRRLKIQSAS